MKVIGARLMKDEVCVGITLVKEVIQETLAYGWIVAGLAQHVPQDVLRYEAGIMRRHIQ